MNRLINVFATRCNFRVFQLIDLDCFVIACNELKMARIVKIK